MFQPHTGNTNTTGTTVDTTVAVPRVLDISLDAVGSVEQGDGVALAGLCTVFTKASTAAALTNGPRLENLAWRLWGRARVPMPPPELFLKPLSPTRPPTQPFPPVSPHLAPSPHLHPADTELPPNSHSVTPSPNLDSHASPAPEPSISASTVTSGAGKAARTVPSVVTSSSTSPGSVPTSTPVDIVTCSSTLIFTSGSPSAPPSVSEATVPSTSVTTVECGDRGADSSVHEDSVGLLSRSSSQHHNQKQTVATLTLHSTSQDHQPAGSHHYTQDHEGQQNEQEDHALPPLVPVALPINSMDAMNMDTAEFCPESVPVPRSKPRQVQPHGSELRYLGELHHSLTVNHRSLVGSTDRDVDENMEGKAIKDAEDEDAQQEQNERQHHRDPPHSRMHIALPVTRSAPETRPDLGWGVKTRAQDQELSQDHAEAVGVALREYKSHESHEGVAEGVHLVPDHQEAVAVGGCLTPGLTPEFEREREVCVIGLEPTRAPQPGNSFERDPTRQEDDRTYNIATGMGTTTQVLPTTTMGLGFDPPASELASAPLPLKQGAPTLARLIKRLFGDVDLRRPLNVVESGSVAHVPSTSLSPSTATSVSPPASTPTSTPSTSATTASISPTTHSTACVAPASTPASASASVRASPATCPAPLPLPYPTVVVVNPTPHPTPPATPSPSPSPPESNTYFRYDKGNANDLDTSGTLNDNIIPSSNTISAATLVLRDGSMSGSLPSPPNGQLATPTSINGDARCGEPEYFAEPCNVNETLGGGAIHPGINSDTGSTVSGHASIEGDSISPSLPSSTSVLSHVLLPAVVLTTNEASSGAAVSDKTLSTAISVTTKPSPVPVTASVASAAPSTTPTSTSALITPASKTAPPASTPSAQANIPISASSYTPLTSPARISVTSAFHAPSNSAATTAATARSTAPPSAPASIASTATTTSATSTAVSTSTPPSTSIAPIPASSVVVEDKKFFLAAPRSIGSGGSEHSSESPDSVGGRYGKKEVLGRDVLGKGMDGTFSAREVDFYKMMVGRKASHRDVEAIVEKMGGVVGREEIGCNEGTSGSMSTSASASMRSGLARGVSSPTLGRGKGRIVGSGRRKGMKKSVVMKDERIAAQRQVGVDEEKIEQKTVERDRDPEREDIAAKGKGKERDVSQYGDGRDRSRDSGAVMELGAPAPAPAARVPLPTVKSMQQLPSHRSHPHLHGQHSYAYPHTNAHGQNPTHMQLHQAHHLRQLPTNPPRRHHSPARRPALTATINVQSGQGQGHSRRNDKGSMRSPTSNTDSSQSRTSLSQLLHGPANVSNSTHSPPHTQPSAPAPAPSATNTRHLPFHPQLSHLGLGHLPTVPPKQRRPIEITETSSEYETTDTEADESSWESESIDRKGGEMGAGTGVKQGVKDGAEVARHSRNAGEETAVKTGNPNPNPNGRSAAAPGTTTNGTNNLRTRDADEFARDAALEAQKQRDMFQKLPLRSYSNQGQLARAKSGLSLLFHPDPMNFPPGHPYHTTRHSRDILARNWSAPGPPLAMTIVGRAAAVAPMQAAVNADPVVSSVNSRGSTTGVPGRSQDGHSGTMQRGGYRPRVKPADQEEETDSGDDDPEDVIQVSSSIAQRRLAALMGSRGPQPQQHSRLPSPTEMTSTTTTTTNLPSQPLARMTTAPVLMMHPYLPDPAPLQTPHTVRRNIISQELDEELRRNLLWERSQNQIQGRPPRAPGSILQGPWRPLSSLKAEESGETQSQVNASDKAPGKRPFGTQRTKSWAGDFHASGW